MRTLLRIVTRYACAIMILQCVAMIFLTYVRGDELGMKERLSSQFAWYYVPIALTYLNDPEPLNYVANATRMDLFTKSFFQSGDVNAALRAAEQAGSYTPSWFIWGNDKGGALYSVIAFETFGVNAKAHYKLFFLLLAGSAGLFLVAFRKEPFKILCLLCLLISLYVLAKPFSQGGLQLGSYHAQRALPVLALIPTLHLLFAMAGPRPWRSTILMIPQAALIVFAYFLRSSAAWAFAAVAVFAVISLAVHWRQIATAGPRREKGLLVAANVCLVPLALVIGMIGVLQAYQKAAFHPRYFEDLITARVLWHNMYMGTVSWIDILRSSERREAALRLFPTGRFGDEGVKDALEAYLKRTGRAAQWENLERPPSQGLVGNVYSLADYDRLVRQMYFDAWRTFPRDILLNYIVRKPLEFAILFADVWKSAETDRQIEGILDIQYGRYFGGAPFDIVPLSFFLLAAFLIVRLRQLPTRIELASAGTLALAPQASWVAAYPTFGAMPEAFVVAAFLCYVAVAIGILAVTLAIERHTLGAGRPADAESGFENQMK